MSVEQEEAGRTISEPVYLGDGLYAEFDGYQIEVYASNGVGKSDRVYFERAVAAAFIAYVKQVMPDD